MKKHLLMVYFLILSFVSILFYAYPTHSYAGEQCPNASELAPVSSADKPELLHALKTIIPSLYPEKEYSEWEVEKALMLAESKTPYVQMAESLCGKPITQHSWVVKLRFPKLLPSASLSEGVIFVAKHQEKGWIAWYKYK